MGNPAPASERSMSEYSLTIIKTEKYDKGKDQLLREVGLLGQDTVSGDRGIIAFKGVAYRLTRLEV